MDKVDIIIVGAGVIGLAVAEAVSRTYPDKDIILLEKHEKFGQETSSRNSEVIHAGMYYPTGSLKARLCVEGNKLLYDFCNENKVPHQRIGKIIITRNADEEAAVKDIYEQGTKNNVPGLRYLTQAEVNEMEPHVLATGALYSETTGIIDTHTLMAKLESLAKENGVMFAYKHEVKKAEKSADGYAVYFTNSSGEDDALETTYIFNCAGLYSDFIPEQLGIAVDQEGYRIYPVKGEYFSVCGGKSKLTSHLIYPPPLKDLKGLGTHTTKSLDGMAKLGPSAFYVDRKDDYDVEPDHLEEFYQAAHSFLPFIEREDLQPDMAGIRAKNQAPGAPWADFIICNELAKGLPGLINLVGIESPGVTACLSIAKYAVSLMK
ncbi:NAD(P)/FAD-dependent oxidoreductase [Sporomusa rhizae]|uniref:NAD(P)/FAD-dependent oxidoreductase n=1 Tax=Sporomusa rhizae TaxID=357999 RepID=UPI00352AE423